MEIDSTKYTIETSTEYNEDLTSEMKINTQIQTTEIDIQNVKYSMTIK
jgi:hypothetical protein